MASSYATIPPAYSLIRNPMYVTIETDEMSGASAPYTPDQDNLSCRLEVWRSLSLTTGFATEEMLGRLIGPYSNEDKQVTFDVSRLVPRVTALPTAASIGISPSDPYWAEAVGLVNAIRFKAADQYGDPVTPEALDTSIPFLTIDGGLPADAVQDINWAGSLIALHSYYYKRSSSYIFYKPVGRSQPDWIYFASLVTDDIRVDVTIHYTDGTTSLFTSHTMAVVVNTAYWMQSGYAQLKIDDNATVGKTVRGYDVSLIRVTGEQNAYTAFYMLDEVCPSWERYILYHNSFGGYETVRMKGVTRYAHRVTRESFERTRWNDFNIEDGNMDDLRVYGSPVFNTHTGHYPSHYVEHLRQLLHGKLWLIDLELTLLNEFRFKRVICETNQVDIRSDIPAADGFSITYRPAWDDDGYNVY